MEELRKITLIIIVLAVAALFTVVSCKKPAVSSPDITIKSQLKPATQSAGSSLPQLVELGDEW